MLTVLTQIKRSRSCRVPIFCNDSLNSDLSFSAAETVSRMSHRHAGAANRKRCRAFLPSLRVDDHARNPAEKRTGTVRAATAPTVSGSPPAQLASNKFQAKNREGALGLWKAALSLNGAPYSCGSAPMRRLRAFNLCKRLDHPVISAHPPSQDPVRVLQ